MSRLAFAAFTVLTAAGCLMSMQDRLDSEAKTVANITKKYCDETSLELRRTFRQSVNDQAHPHGVLVTCATPKQARNSEKP